MADASDRASIETVRVHAEIIHTQYCVRRPDNQHAPLCTALRRVCTMAAEFQRAKEVKDRKLNR